MNKKDWRDFWRIFRLCGFNDVSFYSKDAAMICNEIAIARRTPDSLIQRAANRRHLLSYSRSMGMHQFNLKHA